MREFIERTMDSSTATGAQRGLLGIAGAAAIFPLLVLANFYLFVSLTRLDLSHWPVFNDPYPRVLPANLQRMSIGVTFMAFPFVSLLAVLVSLWGRWRYVDFPVWKLLAAIIACAALLVTMAKIDPGGFLNWFID
jgi:hypothetical protein